MELRHFRYFVAATEELNISKASGKLKVSRLAVSRIIRDPEHEIGAHFFSRKRIGWVLTIGGVCKEQEKGNTLSRGYCDNYCNHIRHLPYSAGSLGGV